MKCCSLWFFFGECGDERLHENEILEVEWENEGQGVGNEEKGRKLNYAHKGKKGEKC